MTKMILSKGNKLNDSMVDDIFDESIERVTDEKVKAEQDEGLNVEDDIFDEALERKLKKDNSDIDNKSYYINRHGEREYICSETTKNEIDDCIIIDVEEKNVVPGIKSEDDHNNSRGTNEALESNLLEIKDEDVYQKDIKLEPVIDSNIKPSMSIKYKCSKCSFKGNSGVVFRKHLLTHEDNGNLKKRIASRQVGTITNINDKLSQTQHFEFENGSTLVNIDILNGDTNRFDSALKLNKNNRKRQSDKMIVNSLNDIDISSEKLNDPLNNGELKGKSSLRKNQKRKLLNHNKYKTNSKMKVNLLKKVTEPNKYRQLVKMKNRRKREMRLNTRLSVDIGTEEIVKNQVKINCGAHQETELGKISPKSILVSQNAESNLETKIPNCNNSNDKIIARDNLDCVGKDAEKFLFSEENERLTDTINKIKYIIYEQDCFKTITNIEHGNNNINKDNKIMGIRKKDLNCVDKNKETIPYSKEFEILAATLSQIKNIICNKDSSLVADKPNLSTNELPKETVTTINAKKTDQLDIPNKHAKSTDINPEYSCTKCTFKAKRRAILKRHLLKHGIEVLNTNILKINGSRSKRDTLDRKIGIEEKHTNESVGESNIGVAAEGKSIKENPICSKRKLPDCHKGKRRLISQRNKEKSIRKEEITEDLNTIIYSCTICSFTAKRQSIVKRHSLLKHDVECPSSITPKVDFIRVVELPKKLKKEQDVLIQDAKNLHIQGRPTETLQNSILYDNTLSVNSEKETKTKQPKSDITLCKDNGTSALNIGKEIETNRGIVEHDKQKYSVRTRPIETLQNNISCNNISVTHLEKETKTGKLKNDITVCKGNGTSALNIGKEITTKTGVGENKKKNCSLHETPIETLQDINACDNISVLNSEKEIKTRKAKSDITDCKDNGTSALNIGKEIETDVNVVEHEKKNSFLEGRPIETLQDIDSCGNISVVNTEKETITRKQQRDERVNSNKETKTRKPKSVVSFCIDNGNSNLSIAKEIEADADVVEHEKKNNFLQGIPIETLQDINSCDNISVVNTEKEIITRKPKNDITVCKNGGTSALNIRKELESDPIVVDHKTKNWSMQGRPMETLQNAYSCDNISLVNIEKETKTRKPKSDVTVCKNDGPSALNIGKELESDTIVVEHRAKNWSVQGRPMETLQNIISCDNISVVNSEKETKTRKLKRGITVRKDNGTSGLNIGKEIETNMNVVEHEKQNHSIEGRPIVTLQNNISCDNTSAVNSEKETKTKKLRIDITVCKDIGTSALSIRKEIESNMNVVKHEKKNHSVEGRPIETLQNIISCNNTSVVNSEKETKTRKLKNDITVCKDKGISVPNIGKKMGTNSNVVQHAKKNHSLQGSPIKTLQNSISCDKTPVVKKEIKTRNLKSDTIVCKDNGTSALNSRKEIETDTNVVKLKKKKCSTVTDKNYSSEDLSYIEMEYSCTKCTFKAKRRSIVKRHYLLKHGIEDANDASLISSVKKINLVNTVNKENSNRAMEKTTNCVARYKNSKNKDVPNNNCKTSELEGKEVEAVEASADKTKITLDTRTEVGDEIEAGHVCDNEKEKTLHNKYENSENKDLPNDKNCEALELEEKDGNTVVGSTDKTKKIVDTHEVTEICHEIEAVYIICNNGIEEMKTENNSTELTNHSKLSAKGRETCLQNVRVNEENAKIIDKEPESILECGDKREYSTPKQVLPKSETKEERESNQSSDISILNELRYSKTSSVIEFERFFKENCVYNDILINNNEDYGCTDDNNMIYKNVENSEVVNKDEDPGGKLNEQEEVKPVITLETVDTESIVKKEIISSDPPKKKIKTEGEFLKLYSCDECSYKTSNKKYLARHKVIHSQTVIKCKMCSYITNHQRNLTLHKLIHLKSDEMEMYKCAHCPYAAKRRRSLKQHMVLHLKDSHLYQCDQCHYRSKRKSNLRIHQVTHKGADELELFKCAVCSFQTKKKMILKSHMILHQRLEDILWYECDKCPFKCKYRSGLMKHGLIHKPPEEVNIYVCPVCLYRTKYKNHLDTHLLLHKDPSEVYMYQCQHCSYKTIKKSNLPVHMLRHKKIEEIDMKKCGHCSFATKLKGNLVKHINRMHSSH